MEIKKIALNDVHDQLGAKMTAFAGYNMPVRYTSDIEEHLTVRKGVGVFDVSHMGEFMLKGENALDLVQRVTSNDASKLTIGKAQYSCLPNETGGIVDDLLVYKMAEQEYMLVVNASNIEKDWNWISSYNSKNVEMKNVSDEMSLFAVQGPSAVKVLQKITDVKLKDVGFYTFIQGKIGGVDDVIISATGYTGAGGFELYVANENALALWNSIFEAGADDNIKPIGLGARDTLRLEMGYCLYGNDIDDATSPLEAGLGWITKFTKEFTNSANLKQQKADGITKKLIGFEMSDKGIPRQGYTILNADKEEIGNVTSGTMSPVLGTGIGMGYVPKEYSKHGTEIFIQIRKRQIAAMIVKPPFLGK